MTNTLFTVKKHVDNPVQNLWETRWEPVGSRWTNCL